MNGGVGVECPADDCSNKLGEDVVRYFLEADHPAAWGA